MFDLASSTSSFLLLAQTLVVVVHRDRQHALGALLTDHVLVQNLDDFARLGQLAAR